VHSAQKYFRHLNPTQIDENRTKPSSGESAGMQSSVDAQ
jgi:hypothetical protein